MWPGRYDKIFVRSKNVLTCNFLREIEKKMIRVNCVFTELLYYASCLCYTNWPTHGNNKNESCVIFE